MTMRFSGTLFRRKSLGVEIGPAGAAFALLGGSATNPCLERVAFRPLAPGALRPSLREANVTDPQAFCDCLREAHSQLLQGGTMLSVTLPDAVGRVLLMDVEGRFKNRAEGMDIIRWKLKKSMPLDVGDTHLDYQKLRVCENSDMLLLVSLVSRSVIGQYEDLIAAAGLVPARIDLNLFNLYRTFERRLSLHDECTLISFYGNSLSIMIMAEGVPEFIRVKELPGVSPHDGRVYREICNSLLAYRERFPERIPQGVACVAAPEAAPGFRDMVSEAIAGETLLLEVKSAVTPLADAPADQATLFPFTAAIGAALRSL
jgi:type IV pilus assembly protein PilM